MSSPSLNTQSSNSPQSDEPASFSPIMASSPNPIPEPVFLGQSLRKRVILKNLFSADTSETDVQSSANSSMLLPPESDSDRSTYLDKTLKQFEKEAQNLQVQEEKIKRSLTPKEMKKLSSRLNFSRELESRPHIINSDHVNQQFLHSSNIASFIKYGESYLKNEDRTLILASLTNENMTTESQRLLGQMLGVSPQKIKDAVQYRQKIIKKEALRMHPRRGQISVASLETVELLNQLALSHSWVLPGANRKDRNFSFLKGFIEIKT